MTFRIIINGKPVEVPKTVQAEGAKAVEKWYKDQVKPPPKKPEEKKEGKE